ncbi:MAG: AraC family transcriptional regulator [Fermentimonas sp.]|nr:AraC family transcriptional regulator [Fermentimonas sp.]
MIDIDSLQLILLNIGFAVHHADWNYKNVKSPFARIYLVKEGSAKLHIPNGRVQELKPKFLYMVPPFTLHSYECDDYFALYYIHIYENEISGISVLEDLMYPVGISASEIDALLVERLFNINPDISLTHYDPLVYDDTQHLISSINYQSNKPIYALLETKGILYQLLTRFLVLSKNKYEIVDDRVLKAIRYIRKNIDKQITVDELVDICCLSKDHFIRIFKNDMQTTPIKYINQKKIERAQLLLITGDKSIKDIAYDLSFENVYYFNRLFKKIIGMTPSEYRSST